MHTGSVARWSTSPIAIAPMRLIYPYRNISEPYKIVTWESFAAGLKVEGLGTRLLEWYWSLGPDAGWDWFAIISARLHEMRY